MNPEKAQCKEKQQYGRKQDQWQLEHQEKELMKYRHQGSEGEGIARIVETIDNMKEMKKDHNNKIMFKIHQEHQDIETGIPL